MKFLKTLIVSVLVFLVLYQGATAIDYMISGKQLAIENQIAQVAAKHKFKNVNFLIKLAEIESGLDPNIKVLDTNNRYSYGLLNFQMETYTSLCVDRYGIDKDIYSLENQVECYIKIHQDLGENFITGTGGWYNSSIKIKRVWGLTP